MSGLEQKWTVDASTDHYVITGIDRETKTVLANFAWHGHGLHHMLTVPDIGDRDGILQAVQEHYERYKTDIETARTHQEPLPDEVQGLIWQRYVTQDQ